MFRRYLAAPALFLVLVAGCDTGTTTPATPAPVTTAPVETPKAAPGSKKLDTAPPATTSEKAL